MNDHDDARLLEGFRRRMAGIEAELPARLPPPPTLSAARPHRPGLLRTAIVLVGSVTLLAAAVGLLVLSAPGIRPLIPGAASPGPSPTLTAPPRDQLTRFDEVTLSDDRRTVHISFVGGAEYSATDPCSVDYGASAQIVGDTLEVAVFKVERPFLIPLLPFQGCPAVGYPRSIEVELAEPFDGYRVRDLAGYVHFLSRPDGLVEITLPAGWELRAEQGTTGSPTGRWRRTYSPQAHVPPGGAPGRLDLYQAFEGPVYVEGTFEQPPVMVGGQPARLFLWPTEGEIVLLWTHGRHGLALVANEADFSVDQLVAIAETATLDDAPPSARSEEVSHPFRLVFEVPWTTVTAEDWVEGWATLELLEGDAAPLGGSGSGLFGFAFVEVGGPREVEPSWTTDCARHMLSAAEPLVSGIERSGGYSADDPDPDADFYREFFAAPRIQLPAGTWLVTAIADFFEGVDCSGRHHLLEATIEVTVTPLE